MRRVIVAIAGAGALVGCTLDTSGVGTAPAGSDGTTAAPTGTGGSESTTMVDGSTSQGPTTTTTTSVPDGSSSSSDSGPVSHPMVSISDGETYDFGPQDIDAFVEHTFVVSNDGDGPAEALAAGGLFDPFIMQSTDCPMTLDARTSCNVTVRFDPDLFGDFTGELRVTFDDAGMSTEATRPVEGRGIGATGNLLVNGGGEEGDLKAIPPEGWDIASGPNWTTTDSAVPVVGDRTIYAGDAPMGFDTFVLHQVVQVSPLTTWGDAEGVRFFFSAYHRAWSAGSDPNHVEFRFADAGVSELALHVFPTNDTSSWVQRSDDWEAPADTHHIQVLLVCDRETGDLCRGYFDEVEVWAQWLGP